MSSMTSASETGFRLQSPVMSVSLAVRGSGDALKPLSELIGVHGWSALDCSTTEFIDPVDLSNTAWNQFQAYRDKVIEGYADDKSA